MPPDAVKRSACAWASSVERVNAGASMGSSSSIQRSPASAYRNVIDSWTKRPAPVASAPSTRCREASRRMRSLSDHAAPRAACAVGGMRVARLHTTSWPATAARTASASKRSTRTGVAPRPSSSSAFASLRATPVTSCPASRRRRTARVPSTPVAPATNTLCFFLASPGKLFSASPGKLTATPPRTRPRPSPRLSDGHSSPATAPGRRASATGARRATRPRPGASHG